MPKGHRLSARSYHRVLKLARTIADLAGEKEIAVQHLAEALQYQPLGLNVSGEIEQTVVSN